MNVDIKLELSHVYESYWDILPREIQKYIIQFKISQENIDEENKERSPSLFFYFTHFSLCNPLTVAHPV